MYSDEQSYKSDYRAQKKASFIAKTKEKEVGKKHYEQPEYLWENYN